MIERNILIKGNLSIISFCKLNDNKGLFRKLREMKHFIPYEVLVEVTTLIERVKFCRFRVHIFPQLVVINEMNGEIIYKELVRVEGKKESLGTTATLWKAICNFIEYYNKVY